MNLNRFRIRTYELKSAKLPERTRLRFCLVSDLHGIEYGKDNEGLLKAIDRTHPDAVLAAGDLQIRGDSRALMVAQKFLCQAAEKHPVFYAPGNHETQMQKRTRETEEFEKYEQAIAEAGVHFLHNASEALTIKHQRIRFWGLEIPLLHYKKPVSPDLTLEEMRELVGEPDSEEWNVLVAHNPKYGNVYFDWGADLTVSGHYHGGILRLGRRQGALSPQFQPLPPYCCGDFYRGEQSLIVSAGLGEHTIPLRVHNPHELVVISVTGTHKTEKKEQTIHGH